MRLLNLFAALSGALALIMLVMVSHVLALETPDADRVRLGAIIQLAASAAGLAVSNRTGRLNLIAGAMVLGGAALFAGTLYALAITYTRALVMLAPVGGSTLILGWIALAFAKPRP